MAPFDKNPFGCFGALFFFCQKYEIGVENRAPKIPKEFLTSKTLNLYQHQRDRRTEPVRRSREETPNSRRKNGLRTISISLVGADLSGGFHSTKISSEFLEPYILPKMVAHFICGMAAMILIISVKIQNF